MWRPENHLFYGDFRTARWHGHETGARLSNGLTLSRRRFMAHFDEAERQLRNGAANAKDKIINIFEDA